MFTKCCLFFKINSNLSSTILCRNKIFLLANGHFFKYSIFASSRIPIFSKDSPVMDQNSIKHDSSFISTSTSSSVVVSKLSNAPFTNLDDATWHELAGKDEFKNWLRICLGLKVCMEFLSPHITSAVEKSFAKFDYIRESQNNKKFTQEEVQKLRGMNAKQREKHFYFQWAREMRKQHRNKNASVKWLAGHALKFSDPTKWHCPKQGPWDIARVYMTGGNMLPRGSSWKSFDAAALLLYIKSNKTCDDFIEDITTVKKLADVRNEMMHCPGYMCNKDRLNENFDHMFSLLKDTRLIELSTLDSTKDKLHHVKCANLNILIGKQDIPDVLSQDKKMDDSIIPLHKENNTNNFSRPEKSSVRRTKSEPVKTTETIIKESDSKNLKCCTPIQTYKNSQESNFKHSLKQRLKSSQESLYNLIKREISTENTTFSCSSKSDNSGENRSSGSKTRNEKRSKKGSSSSNGGGNNKGYFQDKLKQALKNQNSEYYANFDVEFIKGKFYAQVKFISKFAAINQQPRMTEEDAIESAALQALKQQGVSINKNVKNDPCKSLDLLCRTKTGLPPVYHVAPYSSKHVYISTLQIFTPKSLKKDENIFINTKVSCSNKKEQSDAEMTAAATSLYDHKKFHKIPKGEFKQALNEHCVMNGGTIPIYRKISPYTTTVTSFVRNKLTLETNEDEDQIVPNSVLNSSSSEVTLVDETVKKENLCRLGEVDFDMVEAISLVPMRSRECAEESAAKSMIRNLSGQLPESSDDESEQRPFVKNKHKKQLEHFSNLAKWPHAFHTDKIKSHQELHDCVVVSKCLDKSPNEFLITGDSRGKKTAHEAREAAARKAIFMMGMETK